jgi:hypothetical protein
MTQIAFTDLTVRSLKPGLFFDTRTPGFGIRVGKNRRTWLVLKGTNSIKVRLGHYYCATIWMRTARQSG